MNKTFKVVFNRARGALMVANEVTSSMQKKGTKTVLAVAALSLISTASFAEAINSWTGVTPTIESTAVEFKGSDKTTDVYFLNVGEAATGKIEDLSLTMKGIGPKDGTTVDVQLSAVYNHSSTSAVEFGGKTLNLTVGTDFVGHGNSHAAAMNLENATNITADEVSLSVTSTNSNGKSIYGIAAGKAKISLSSNEVNINLGTATNRTTDEAKEIFSEAIGIDIYSQAIFDATKVSTLTITGESKGATTTTNGVNGGSSISGIVFEGGTGNFGGTTIVNLTAQGGNATGVKATNYYYNNTQGANWGNAAGTLNNLEATVHSETATASGIGVSYTSGTDTNNVILDVKGDSKLVATTNTGKAYGVNLSGETEAKFEGNVTVNVKGTGKGSTVRGVASAAGTISFTGTDKSVEITASAVKGTDGNNSRAINASGGGIINLGIIDADATKAKKLKSITVVSDSDAYYAAQIHGDKTALNVNAGTYTQTGSMHGIYVRAGATLTMNVDEFSSTTAYTAIHTRESASSKAEVTAKTFTATATGNEAGVAVLQVNEGSTLTVKADTVALIGTNKLCGGVLGTGTYGTLTLSTKNLSMTGNINGTYGSVNNQGQEAKFDIKATESLNLTGNINVGSLGSTNALLTEELKAEGAVSSFSRNTAVSIEAGKATIDGDINVWGNVSSYGSTADENTVTLNLGDGSKVTGNISILGQSVSTQKNAVSITATGKNKDLAFVGNITATKVGAVSLNGGTYTVSKLEVDSTSSLTVTDATLKVTDATEKSSLTLKGTSELDTTLATAFTTTKDSSTVSDASARLSISGDKTAKLTIDDVFTYTADALKKMAEAYKAITLNLTKATLAVSETEKAELVDGVIQGSTTVEVTVAKDTESVSLGTSTANVTTGAQTIVLDKSADVTVNNLTVVGKTDGSAFIENAKSINVVEGATLNLGSAEAEAATSGTLPEITLEKTATLNVTNTAVTTSSLTGGEGVKINLGTTEAAGVLHTEKLALNGAMIFLDPAWQNGSTISDASSFSAVTVDNLNGTIVAGQNSIVALGATKDAAVSGFNKLAQTNSLTWGSEGITAGLYLGKAISLAVTPDVSAPKILVNGSLTTAPTSVDATGLTIASNGILMLDQASIGTKAAVSGATVTIADDATVAVINAKGGTTLTLSDAKETPVTLTVASGTAPETKTVLTDNPFVKGTLTASSGTIALSDYADETGINVIASMGVQSMIRHADAVLAETIADRAAEAVTGNGLWVSVRGERFEQKKLGGGAGFKANMGYGAFGAEFTPTDATSLGVAFQYGFGTVKGKLYSAKNKTKDYGFTVYGSALLGDTGVKLLGEVSYTKSTNDLTNNYFTGLNQDLDAKMISGGITAQKHFAAGSFDLVPSVGVRVSRITTDAMKAGESRIAKQKQTLVQVPIALRVNAKAIETEGGWAITPRFKVAFVPTFGDKEIKIFGAEKTVLDTTPVQGAFGVSFVKGNFTIDATANLGVSNKDTSSIGGKVGLSYRF